MLWVRPETEQPCFAGRHVEQQRQQHAVRQSQQQHTVKRQQQHWFPVCEGDSTRGGRRVPALSRGRSAPVHGLPQRPERKPTGRSLFPEGCERGTNKTKGWRLVAQAKVSGLILLVAGLCLPLESLAATAQADSPSFTLDTVQRDPSMSGAAGANSTVFSLDTRPYLGPFFVGGMGTSSSFTLDTRGTTTPAGTEGVVVVYAAQSWNATDKMLTMTAKGVDPVYGNVSAGDYRWTLQTAGGQSVSLGTGGYNSTTKQWQAGQGFSGGGLPAGHYLVRHEMVSERGRSGATTLTLTVGGASTVVSGTVRGAESGVGITGAQVALFKASGSGGFWTLVNGNYGGVMPPLGTLLANLTPARPVFTTGLDGAYWWTDVPAGESYVVVVSATGYVQQRSGSFSVSAAGSAITRNFSLKLEDNTLASLLADVTTVHGKARDILDYNAETAGRLTERYYEDDLYGFEINWFSKVAGLIGSFGDGVSAIAGGAVATSSDEMLTVFAKTAASTLRGLVLVDQSELLRVTVQNNLFPPNALAYKEWVVHQTYDGLLTQAYGPFTQAAAATTLAPGFSKTKAGDVREQVAGQMDKVLAGTGVYVASPLPESPIRGFTMTNMAVKYYKESEWLKTGKATDKVTSSVQLAAGSVLIFSWLGGPVAPGIAAAAGTVNQVAGAVKTGVAVGSIFLKSAMAAQYVNTIIGTYPTDNENAYRTFKDYTDCLEQEAANPFYLRDGNRFDATTTITFPKSVLRDDVLWAVSGVLGFDVVEKWATVKVTDASSVSAGGSSVDVRCASFCIWQPTSLQSLWGRENRFLMSSSSFTGPATAAVGGEVELKVPYRGHSKQLLRVLKPHALVVDTYVGPWRVGGDFKTFYVLRPGEVLQSVILPSQSALRLTSSAEVLSPVARKGRRKTTKELLESSRPAVVVAEDSLSAAIPALTANFTAGTNLWALDVLLLAPADEGVSLLITDSQGRRMGYSTLDGLSHRELTGAVTDMGQRPIVVRLFQPPPGEQYTATVALLAPGRQAVPVSLFQQEEETTDATMLVSPSRAMVDLGIGDDAVVEVMVGEESEQAALTNVTATLTNLVQWNGTNVVMVLTNQTQDLDTIPAGGSVGVQWPVDLAETAPGKYVSQITVASASAGEVSVPVVALVRRAAEVVSLFAGTNLTSGEMQVETTLAGGGHTQTWVHVPKGFYVLHGALAVAPASTNLQSPSLDIGADGVVDWAFSGLMDVGVALSDIEGAFNEYLKTNSVGPAGANVPIKVSGNAGESLLMAGLQLYLERVPNELRAMEILPNGQARFQMLGEPGFSYTIQASTNLVDWSAIGSVQVTNASMPVVDVSAPAHNARFYRAVLE